MTAAPLLSVVLPCRNQADHIEAVLTRYFAPLDAMGSSYELVVVPNASTDGTTDVVRRIGERDRRLRVVENPAGGWGRSVLAGLAEARGEALCYTNSARTEPAHVVALFELYLRYAPCVAKVCREKRNAIVRETGSWLYNLEGRLLFGIRDSDVNGTPKILSRALFERLALSEAGDLLDMELLAKARRLGVPIREMAVPGFKRHGGRSSTNLGSAWRMYVGAVRLRRRLGPSGRGGD